MIMDDVTRLIEELKHEDLRVRTAAAEALGHSGDAHAVTLLIHVLEDSAHPGRWQAIEVLGTLCDARAVVPLIAALQDEERRIRRLAATVLEIITTSEPRAEIWGALPLLRFVAQSSESTVIKETCRQAIRHIEKSAATVRNLPLPAAPPLPSAESLPRPAAAPLPPADDLPVPAAAPDDGVKEAEAADDLRKPGWWERLWRALRPR